VRVLSTAPDEDLLVLLRRVLFTWLIADGDMHLKNMALLKIAHSGDAAFRTVRFAPVYDTLTTRVLPGLAHDRMALKLSGKDERLRRADFMALATLAGLRAGDAQVAIEDVLQRLPHALDALVLPRALGLSADARATVDRTFALIRSRAVDFD
jgi:serine/threonine-protein kinase HipA